MAAQENVELANIERELNRLWQQQIDNGTVRACLFNLIIYSEDQRRADYIKELIDMVVERFPCRIIYIAGDVNAKSDKLKTSVSAVASGTGSHTIACEQVNIEVAGKHIERAPFIILPHIVPDLPVYLLWAQDPTTDSAILPHLERYATRILFDSDCTDNLQRFSKQLLLRLSSTKKETIDLNWARLRGWRNILAQVFDSPHAILQLAASKTIEIRYNCRCSRECAHSEFPATYLQSWLAAQIAWRPVAINRRGANMSVTYTNGLQEATVTLIPEENRDLPGGVINGIAITTHSQYIYVLQRCGSGRQVNVKMESPDACQLPLKLPLPAMDRSSQFMREVFYSPPSEQYRSMLQTLSTLNL